MFNRLVVFSAVYSVDMYSDDIFQLNIFLYSVGFGFLSALFYDVFKTVQQSFFNTLKGLFYKDIIYGISIFFFYFIFVLTVNNGKIRIYLVVGLILGFICWFISLSSVFIKYFGSLLKSLKIIFYFSSEVITFPVRLIYSLLSEKFIKINIYLQTFFKKAKNKFKKEF